MTRLPFPLAFLAVVLASWLVAIAMAAFIVAVYQWVHQ